MITAREKFTTLLFRFVISAILPVYFWQQPLELKAQTEVISEKITFDISKISPEGLIGAADGLRSVSYEFCLPANPAYLETVKKIDKNIQYYPNSPGRIGCDRSQYLCIGHTHNPEWKEILIRLANLPYIQQINEFFAE